MTGTNAIVCTLAGLHAVELWVPVAVAGAVAALQYVASTAPRTVDGLDPFPRFLFPVSCFFLPFVLRRYKQKPRLRPTIGPKKKSVRGVPCVIISNEGRNHGQVKELLAGRTKAVHRVKKIGSDL